MSDFTTLEDWIEDSKRELAANHPIVRFLKSKAFAGYNQWAILTSPRLMFVEVPGHFARKAKWAWQRTRRGYSDYDRWSLDSFILSWLPDAIADLRENAHGCPMTMYDDTSHFWDYGERTAEADAAGFDKWKAILTSMEEGLRDGNKATDVFLTQEENEEARLRFLAAWELVGEHFFSLWD